MRSRSKLIAIVGALTIVLAAPTAAEAKSRPNTFRFTGATNVSNLNVTCAPGATKGTVPIKVKVMATRNFSKKVSADFIGNSLGQSTKFIASYPGGSLTLGRFELLYTINSAKTFRFPCPNTDVGGTSQFTIVIQPYRGKNKIGTAGKVEIRLHRVGAGS